MRVAVAPIVEKMVQTRLVKRRPVDYDGVSSMKLTSLSGIGLDCCCC